MRLTVRPFARCCRGSQGFSNGLRRLLGGGLAALLIFVGSCRQSPPPPRIVAFGDSITRGYGVAEGEGWVELLAARLKGSPEQPGIPVFNAGGNGNTSAEGLSRLETDVLAHLPGLVLVEFGGNDTVHDAQRHVPVDAFEQNLQSICRRIEERGGELVLVTFPPLINAWHAAHSDSYYDRWGGPDQCIEEYRERTRAWAQRQGYPLFDLDHLLREQIAKTGPEPWILPDGVHLTPAGHQWLSAAMFQFLRDKGKLRGGAS